MSSGLPMPRLVVSAVEYDFARDPIPPYWATYEHPLCGLEPPWQGCEFDLVSGEAEIVDGISVFPTPGHSPGHQAVSVRTEAGNTVLAGDLFFVRENLEPDCERGWPLTPCGRFASFIDLWHSMVTTIERADHILMSHDPSQLDGQIFP